MSNLSADSATTEEQITFYRANVDDEWFPRQGRYDCGAKLNVQLFADVAEIRSTLAAFALCEDVLEFACSMRLGKEGL